MVLDPSSAKTTSPGESSSQLGAVTVSAVPDEKSSEVGGLQNTLTNLGASLGTALQVAGRELRILFRGADDIVAWLCAACAFLALGQYRMLQPGPRGWSFARFDDSGRVVFKAEVACRTDNAAQIQGVYVAPELRGRGCTVATGVFGARMQVSSVNEGPMTLLLEV